MNPWSGLRNLPKEVWVMCLAVLVNRAGMMVLPFLVLYLTRVLDFSAGRAGLTVALYGLGALITAPLSGWLTDRYGTVLIMRASLFLSGIVLFFFPYAHNFTGVVIATLLLAITTEMFRPANLALISHVVQPEQRKAAFALVRLAINLGMSIGPALGGILASSSFYYLFLIDGATSLAAGVVMMAFQFQVARRAESSVKRKDSEEPVIPSRRAISDRTFLFFLIATVLISIVFFQHIAAMPLFMVRNLHLSPAIYGLMFTINTLLIVALEVPLNLATSHWSHRRTHALGALLFGFGFGGFAFAHGLWGVIASVAIWTFGEMILFPAMASYVSQIAPADRQGEYMGFYTMTFGLAFIIGPWMGTRMLDRWGASVLWGTMFWIGVVSALIMSWLTEERILPETALS